MTGVVATLAGVRTRVLLVVPIALAAVALLAVALHDEPDGLDRAREALASDEAFTRSSTAGEALLEASVQLQRAGTDCDDGPACDRLLTASAMARVSSVQLLECRRPEVFAFRDRFRQYLDQLDAGADPTPPSPPFCD